MSAFRTIDELILRLNREKALIKDLFEKRKDLSIRRSYAEEMLDYYAARLRFLIESGIIHESGEFVELEDVYLRFFEEVLEVNEEVNVSSVKDYIDNLNAQIGYFLKENNERQKYGYQKEVRKILKKISLTTLRNIIDLKRNINNTYKNEPNYKIKIDKLRALDVKRNNIKILIHECERVLDERQPTFFSVAMDVQMRETVNDVRAELIEAAHSLIEIQKQIIQYINLIEFQTKRLKKLRRLKYLRDQLIIKEYTNVEAVMLRLNPVWLEPQMGYRLKLSLDYLRTSNEALEILKLLEKRKNNRITRQGQEAEALDTAYLKATTHTQQSVSQQEMINRFRAQAQDLFTFVQNYRYRIEVTEEEKLVLFCQLASQYADQLQFTDTIATHKQWEYPLIYIK